MILAIELLDVHHERISKESHRHKTHASRSASSIRIEHSREWVTSRQTNARRYIEVGWIWSDHAGTFFGGETWRLGLNTLSKYLEISGCLQQ